ncbi:MAG: hypothetical protein HZB43_03355 [candidate division Zixibacteria bacterium]|nr:hypothetical protein [candidate division Zixibacteria bacterium]
MKHIMRRYLILSVLIVLGAQLAGCSRPVDPVEQCRVLIPKLTDAINKHDLYALKDLGSDKFEPNNFVKDLFAHGYSGAVTIAFQRFRAVTGENRMTVNVGFGPNQSGGLKELTIYFTGEKKLKIDTYSFSDVRLPSGEAGPGAAGNQGR